MMKTKTMEAVLLSACALAVAGCKTDSGVQETPPVKAADAVAATDSSTRAPDVETIKAIAEEATIYGFPLVMNYKVFHDSFLDPSAKGYKGSMNEVHSDARVYTPQDKAVQTPNSDTPYSLIGADLRAEPIVISIPDIEEGRYYNVQMVDMYTHNYGYAGSRATGNKAGDYLVATYDWDGTVPEGVSKVYRCESPFSMIVLRTQLFNAADIENIKRIQAAYKVQPLSSYLGKPAPAPAPEIQWPPAPKSIFGDGLFPMVNFLMQFLPPTGPAAGEKEMRERFAQIGIGPDAKIKMTDLTPGQKAALGAGLKAAYAKINAKADSIGTPINGWRIGCAAGSREFYDGNYLLRAVGSKVGIYGNDSAEATYPYAKTDVNGHVLDGSKHRYSITFPAGGLPPAKSFWSITIYDARSQFLVDNPINRYLINKPMLDDLKKNDDGSITIYLQRDTPGKALESNWLPAPDGPIFAVMRIYWPQTEDPSVLPLGKGSWAPPPIIPVGNLNARGVSRPGYKSVGNVVRTDDRYGCDPFYNGPRGWPYWNFLEYPKPIQNPNLWPDSQSTYFLSQFELPAGSSITFKGGFPHARYFKFALYSWNGNTFVSIGQDLPGKAIVPDGGSINPFVVGNERLSEKRDFTFTIIAEDPPADENQRKENTLYAGKGSGKLQMVTRIYLSDQGWDGAGFGPADQPFNGRGLPVYEGRLADGTQLAAEEVVNQFVIPMDQATKQPISESQWIGLVNAPDNDPTLDTATAPAHQEPKWVKYWNIKYSILGAFKPPEERAKIPYKSAMDGGGDTTTQYFLTFLSRKFGEVYVMRGKMPTFPDTFAGVDGRGLKTMPDAECQYWSLVSCEAAPSGQIVDGLTDMQVPLDEDRNFTIVYSRKEDRPANATIENGVAWIEWSPNGEGLHDARNRKDFGMLMLRIMATNPTWAQRPDLVEEPGMEEPIMGPYLPVGEYVSKSEFEANKLNI